MSVHLKFPYWFILTFGLMFMVSCGEPMRFENSNKGITKERKEIEQYLKNNKLIVELQRELGKFGLCDVSLIDSSIWFDIKYFGQDNFMHQKLYQTINRPYLQKDVALRLVACSKLLQSIDTSLHLLIYDAVRPVSVQKKMWNALDSLPPRERVKFVSNPINKSLHNYGAAVDITICRSDRSVLDMGAGFDDARLIAYPSKEAYFLSTGELTKEQWNNRRLLRRIMRSHKFRNLPTEWWHFNACPRWEARLKYKLLEYEPSTR